MDVKWMVNAYVPVLPGEKWAIYVGDKKVTTNLRKEIIKHMHEEDLKEYVMRQHGITRY